MSHVPMPLDPWSALDELVDIATARGLLSDALDVVSGLVDEVLPALVHAAADEGERERMRDAAESAGQAWAHLTVCKSVLEGR